MFVPDGDQLEPVPVFIIPAGIKDTYLFSVPYHFTKKKPLHQPKS